MIKRIRNSRVGMRSEQALRLVLGYIRIHAQNLCCSRKPKKRRSMMSPSTLSAEGRRSSCGETEQCSRSCERTPLNEAALAQVLRQALLQQSQGKPADAQSATL